MPVPSGSDAVDSKVSPTKSAGVVRLDSEKEVWTALEKRFLVDRISTLRHSEHRSCSLFSNDFYRFFERHDCRCSLLWRRRI